MATVGQIIYNVQDYQNSGGYISTSKEDRRSIVSSVNSDGSSNIENYNSKKVTIFGQNILSVLKYNSFTKLGVNAPPGTRFILNTDKIILVGRSGIYELDSDINITSLEFIRPRRYILDKDQTTAALNNGINGFQTAENNRINSLSKLKPYDSSEEDEEVKKNYWEQYNTIQNTYNTAYQEALAQYNMGLNGIYKLPKGDNPNAEENYEDLYNIIIDFLYE